MNIKSISCVSFGKHYTNVDIGASSINGSLKIKAIDENGNTICGDKLTVFRDGEKRTEDAFQRNVADRVLEFETKNQALITEKDPENVALMTFCYPGPKLKINGQNVVKTSNFFYDDARQNRFKKPISTDIIDSYLMQSGIKVKQTKHVNDMAGAGACLLSKIEQENPEMLKEGSEILYLYPGGGLGSGIIMVDKGNIKIKPTETQHVKVDEETSLETNVGAKGIANNFCRALGFSDEQAQKLGTDIKALTHYDELIEMFPFVEEDDYNQAVRVTADKFMDSLAQMVGIQICTAKVNNVIITGNIAHSIRDSVNNNPLFKEVEDCKADGDDKFNTIFKNKIRENLTPIGAGILGDVNNAKINFIRISDNTEGAQILQDSEEVGEAANWYNLNR